MLKPYHSKLVLQTFVHHLTQMAGATWVKSLGPEKRPCAALVLSVLAASYLAIFVTLY